MNQTFQLTPFAGESEFCCKATIYWEQRHLRLIYSIEDLNNDLFWQASPFEFKRQSELWNSTCLEFFVFTGEKSYLEWNFAPHGAWDCFHFDDYRSPNSPRRYEQAPLPLIKVHQDGNTKELEVHLVTEEDWQPSKFNLSAVLIKENRPPEFFALSHKKQKADFHDSSLFFNS